MLSRTRAGLAVREDSSDLLLSSREENPSPGKSECSVGEELLMCTGAAMFWLRSVGKCQRFQIS